MLFKDAYEGKKVLVTGHTGFKGSWLCEWLHMLGAEVIGFSLRPDPESDACFTAPYAHFSELHLADQLMVHLEGDVRDLKAVTAAVNTHRPDFIFHLAAQPLVLRGYQEPHLTVETNAMGTLNVLEAVRAAGHSCVCVMITTDKVYENTGWVHAYRENDRLGGHDTYSASKACAELIISSYWRSFFAPSIGSLGIAVAAVRGGNVIGGGDWAKNRIVPDVVRALSDKQPVVIRNRHATRPWQHVLEPLSGYLHLGALLRQRLQELNETPVAETDGATARLWELCSPFNFGPNLSANRPVGRLVEEIFRHWPGEANDQSDSGAPREAGKLNLTIDKAHHVLGWEPKWRFDQAVARTVSWYKVFYSGARGNPQAVRSLTRDQILDYTQGLSYRVNR